MRSKELRQSKYVRRACWLAGLWLCVCLNARAERLPIKTYTTADGLAHNIINKIVRDSRGFLWFCTNEGLSRFDGYAFTNYGIDQGLPHAVVSDILETRAGDYWVATNGGLCKFNPLGVPTSHLGAANSSSSDTTRKPMFTVVTPAGGDQYSKAINTLLEGRDGTIWCGTLKGLFRIAQAGDGVQLLPVDIGLPTEYAEQRYVNALLEDRYGTLWLGTPSGLYRRWPDGSAARYSKSTGLPDDYILCLLEDHRGNLWVGTPRAGLWRLATEATRSPPVITRAYTEKNGLTTNWVFALYESAAGRLWVGTNKGLCELTPDAEYAPSFVRAYTERNGLSFREVVSVTEDRDGNLWLGTNTAGAMKLTRNGFTMFDERDGLSQVTSLFESNTGELYAYGYVLGNEQTSVFEGAKLDLLNPGPPTLWRRLGRFDGQRFAWLIPNGLRHQYLGWSDRMLALQARTGEWWIGTGVGLYLFPRTDNFAALKTARPIATYTVKDGLAAMEVYSIYEALHGDLWVATVAPDGNNGLARWERATRRLRDMAHTEGLPTLKDRLPTAFEEDAAGNLWVGFNRGELARYHDGRFTVFTSADGLPTGRINDLYLGRDGRLWIATERGGISRVDDPVAARPTFINYSTAAGLSSNSASAITEDLYGRIYVGTGQGLDRLDPTTARIKHYTTADGLAPGTIIAAFRDRHGWLWFGAVQGLSRFLPEPEQPSPPPPILIDGLRVAGARQPVSAVGETVVALPDLPATQNQLQIDFVGLSFAPGESLRYQYRLEGADADWGAPTTLRTINYANLAPGRYRFLVRAVTADGGVSPTPAVVAFTVLSPIWQRWWFLTLAALLSLTVGYRLYRYRVTRLLAVANMRTRIATDLHDDIGAGLSRMAILSEVVKQQLSDTTAKQAVPLLTEIADSARGLVDSMRDIVWAIDPRRDDLSNVVSRVRQFAADVLEPQKIKLDFHVPVELAQVKLDSEQRRHLFLIFKEALNNIARHADCATVALGITVAHNRLTAEIRDDGRGFAAVNTPEPPTNGRVGHGLENMQSRAAQLGGRLSIDSWPGRGTCLHLTIPLSKR